MTCGTCRHFRQHERDDAAVGGRVNLPTGRCRRYPPQLVFDSARNVTGTAWPVVRREDGCGEHREAGGDA